MLSCVLLLQLFRPPHRDVLGLEVAECRLQPFFDDVAARVIDHHDERQSGFEGVRELDELQLLVDLWDEFRRARKSYASHKENAPVHALVLRYAFPEGSALVIDGERGDLLHKLEEIDGAVEKRWLEFSLEIDIASLGLGLVDVIRNVDQRNDMNGKLSQDRSDDVEVEDVGLRSFLRQAFDGLKTSMSMLKRV